MAEPAFWMVWRHGSGAPTYQHTSEQSAREEAERLVRRYPGHVFYVLRATAAVRKTDLAWSEITSPASEAPF